MHVEGQLTKLERFGTAIEYLRKSKIAIGSNEEATEALKSWKKTLRAEKGKNTVNRLEMTSDLTLEMDDITRVADNAGM